MLCTELYVALSRHFEGTAAQGVSLTSLAIHMHVYMCVHARYPPDFSPDK